MATGLGAARALVVALPLVACAMGEPPRPAGAARDAALELDLSRLSADGLYGPPDGLRALHYEFCIPAEREVESRVRSIDQTLEVQRGSPGRVGCAADQWLCLGHTHQPGFRDVLARLAALPEVERIVESVFE